MRAPGGTSTMPRGHAPGAGGTGKLGTGFTVQSLHSASPPPLKRENSKLNAHGAAGATPSPAPRSHGPKAYISPYSQRAILAASKGGLE